MRRFVTRRWLAGGLLLLHIAAACAVDRAGAMFAPRLSAAGDRLAFVSRGWKHDRIVVRELGAQGEGRELFRVAAGSISRVEWLDAETLVATTRVPGFAPALRVLALDDRERALTAADQPEGRYRGARPLVLRGDGLLYASDHRLAQRPDLYLWTLWSERPRRVARNPGDVLRWIVDAAGRPRARLSADGNRLPPRYRLQWRGRDGEWRRLHEWALGGRALQPFAVAAGGNSLWVRRVESVGSSLVRLDADNGMQTEWAALAGRSLRGFWPSPGDGRPALVEFGGHLPPSQKVLDARWGRWQERIDRLLPNTRNRIVDSGKRVRNLLVFARSDRHPGAWYRFNTQSGRIERLGVAGLEPAPGVARQRRLALTTADGLRLSGFYWTAAAAEYPAPAVVLVHGGPWARDRWGYNRLAQRLAAAGIVVLQLNFRGSRGFGSKLLLAGRRQWGQAMQADLVAGVNLLVRAGLADPEQVCIAGKSYGGYAALMGVLREPGRYRCAMAHAPVTDIVADIQALADAGNELAVAEWRYMVGDPREDPSRLHHVSPISHADSLSRPVLLSHGLRDGRVDPDHSHRFRRRAPPQHVRWLAFPEQGHDLRSPAAARRLEDAWVGFAQRWLLQEAEGQR